MKKLIACLLAMLSIFCLFGCSEDSSDTHDNKYKLKVVDNFNYLLSPLEEYYEAGEEVEVQLKFVSELSKVEIKVNGKLITSEIVSDNSGNKITVVTFNMPNKDSTLYTTRNGYIKDDCGEENHTWDEGQILTVPGSENAKDKVYTCTSCGKTKSERVN